MTDQTDALLSLKRSRASNESWAATADWSGRTANGRKAADDRFLALANGDPKRAAKLRQVHYQKMAERSVAVRKARAAARAAAADDGGAA